MTSPEPPFVQATSQSTEPCDVATAPFFTAWPTAITFITATGSSLAAARPGGYTDGSEDAVTVPSAAITTTAVTACPPWSGPAASGTTRVMPSRLGRDRPGWAGWPGWPSTVPAGTPWGYCAA